MDSNPYIKRYRDIFEGTGVSLVQKPGAPIKPSKSFANGSETTINFLKYFQKIADQKGKSISILDYGSGKAFHTWDDFMYVRPKIIEKTSIHKFMKGAIQCYYCYDPSVAEYVEKPAPGSKFDAVVMADVGEHIPEQFIPETLKEAVSYLKPNGAFLISVSGQPAYHFFNNNGELGENFHITIKSYQWWAQQLRNAFVAHPDATAVLKYIKHGETAVYVKNGSTYKFSKYKQQLVFK